LDENLSAAQVFDTEDLVSLFHLPLSRVAFEELSQLQLLMHGNRLTDQNDI
jgi:hypothetical protein